MVPCADLVQDPTHCVFQRLGVAVLGRHPAVLDQMPELFDAVQLGTVRWQEVQRHALAAQHRHQRRHGTRRVDRGVIQDDRQGLGDPLIEQGDETGEQGRREGTPELGTEDRPVRQQRGNDIEALAARRLDALLLADGCPRAAVWMDRRASGFVQVRHVALAGLGTRPQRGNLLFCAFKGHVIAFF